MLSSEEEARLKDLTNIFEQIQNTQAEAPPADSIPDIPAEKLTEFESLEDFSKSHPEDLPPEAAIESDSPVPVLVSEPAASADWVAAPALDPVPELAEALPSESTAEPTQESPPEPAPEPTSETVPALASEAGFDPSPGSIPDLLAEPSVPDPPAGNSALDQVRKAMEAAAPSTPADAAFPFHLRITGTLSAAEQARLLDLLEREQFGIDPKDLEPQLEAGRLLLPRISEYAGVLVIQALRDAKVAIAFRPSEPASVLAEVAPTEIPKAAMPTDEPGHRADSMPVVPESFVSGREAQRILATVSSVVVFPANLSLVEGSERFQERLEGAIRELRYRAFRKGADAVVSLRIQVTRLDPPTHLQICALGNAVKWGESETVPAYPPLVAQDRVPEPTPELAIVCAVDAMQAPVAQAVAAPPVEPARDTQIPNLSLIEPTPLAEFPPLSLESPVSASAAAPQEPVIADSPEPIADPAPVPDSLPEANPTPVTAAPENAPPGAASASSVDAALLPRSASDEIDPIDPIPLTLLDEPTGTHLSVTVHLEPAGSEPPDLVK